MTLNMDVNGFIGKTEAELRQNLAKVGIHATNKIKEKISTGQLYHRYGQKAVYYRGEDPSLPGQAPKLITGQLRASVTWEVTKDLTLRIGSNMPYALALELGTVNMAARPYIRSTIIEEQDRIKEILAGK